MSMTKDQKRRQDKRRNTLSPPENDDDSDSAYSYDEMMEEQPRVSDFDMSKMATSQSKPSKCTRFFATLCGGLLESEDRAADDGEGGSDSSAGSRDDAESVAFPAWVKGLTYVLAFVWSLGCLLLIVVFSMQFDLTPQTLSYYDECGAQLIESDNIRDIAKWGLSILFANLQDFFVNQPFTLFLLSMLTVFLTRAQPPKQSSRGSPGGKGLSVDIGSSPQRRPMKTKPVNLDFLVEGDSDSERDFETDESSYTMSLTSGPRSPTNHAESRSSTLVSTPVRKGDSVRSRSFKTARDFHHARRHSIAPPSTPSSLRRTPMSAHRNSPRSHHGPYSPQSTPTSRGSSIPSPRGSTNM